MVANKYHLTTESISFELSEHCDLVKYFASYIASARNESISLLGELRDNLCELDRELENSVKVNNDGEKSAVFCTSDSSAQAVYWASLHSVLDDVNVDFLNKKTLSDDDKFFVQVVNSTNGSYVRRSAGACVPLFLATLKKAKSTKSNRNKCAKFNGKCAGHALSVGNKYNFAANVGLDCD
ncbi:MAG: hypothetical protein K2G31_00025, partial [Clostridia bacterium]|nr:hypothetical protein [Clostridia bacterium]